MPPEERDITGGEAGGEPAGLDESGEASEEGWAVLDESGEGLVLVDSGGAAYPLPDEESEEWVLLDDRGEEWTLVDDASAERATVEQRGDRLVLVDEGGEEYAVLDEGDEEHTMLDDSGVENGRERHLGELHRRTALKLTASGVVATSLLAGAGATLVEDENDGTTAGSVPEDIEFDYPTAIDKPFAHGVASGDPLSSRVILWTRLTYEEPPEQASVDYEVGTDPALSSVVTSGTAQTGPGRDWTVKVDATGLDPGTTYYYRFSTGDATSIVGRTRTAPAGGVSELRFGVVSCSSYWSGYFNAYGRLADRNSLDLIIHCGDHIYDFPDPQEHRRARHDLFDGEYVDFRRWETVDEARRRYALHYSDPDHLRVHQQHPFTIVWDNHDIGDSGDDTEVTTEEERQAFWEWTPTRPVKPDGSGDPLPASEGYVEPEDNRYVYRRLPYGDLADVIVADHTQWQSDGRETGSERTLLGAEQFEWLTETMVDSAAAGTDWRLVLNPRYIAPFRAASLPEKLPLLNREELQEDLVYTTSQWDGYPAERERFCERLREHAVDDTIFATGDMHMNWCSDVTEEPIPAAYDAGTGTGERHSVGVSFAPSSVSRGGADETIQGALSGLFPDDILRRVTVGTTRFVEDEIAATNPNVQFIEWVEHGYGIAHVTEEETRLDYWWTPIDRRTPQQEFGAQMRVPRSDDQMRNHAIRVSDPEPTMGTRTDPPAPFPDGLDGF